MTGLEFLQEKGLIKKGYTKFEIGGDFGVFELTDLLKEYHEKQLKLCGVVSTSVCEHDWKNNGVWSEIDLCIKCYKTKNR